MNIKGKTNEDPLNKNGISIRDFKINLYNDAKNLQKNVTKRGINYDIIQPLIRV